MRCLPSVWGHGEGHPGVSAGTVRDLSDDPPTEELRADQARRESAEREMAAEAADPEEARAHARRAERAAYLREKLDEQARSQT